MKRPDPIILGIIIVTVIVIGGIIAVAASSQPKQVSQYQTNDADRPKAEIGATSFNFGNMKLSDTKTQETTLKNTGTKPLILSDIVTSCDCTFAQVVVAGRESKRFSMQRDTTWQEQVQSGETATIRIIYEPRIMPVKGTVNRSVAIKTNDPAKPLINLSFTANVQQ